MVYRVLGIEKYSGEYQGKPYSGKRLFCQYPDSYQSPRLKGVKVELVKVSDNLSIPDIQPGDDVEVFYNRYGNVENVQLV